MSLRSTNEEGAVASKPSVVTNPTGAVAEVYLKFTELIDETFDIRCRLDMIEKEVERNASRPSRKNRTRRKSR